MLHCGDLVIEELINQTHSVRYSTNIDSVQLHYLTIEKSIHYMLADLMCLFVVFLLIEERMKQTDCVICFINIDSVLLDNFTSEKSDTIC